MKNINLKPILGLILLIAVVSGACGFGANPTPTQTPTSFVPTKAPIPSPTKTLVPPTPTETQVPPTPTSPPPTETSIPLVSLLPSNCTNSIFPGYMTCTDTSRAIMLDVPNYWTDIVSGPWEHEGSIIGKAISAAPNLTDFNASCSAEGVFFGATDTLALIGGYIEFLDYFTEIYAPYCTLVGRYDFNDNIYRGKYDYYINCEGPDGYDAYVLSAVNSQDQFSMIITMYFQVLPGDTLIRDQIWQSFMVLDL